MISFSVWQGQMPRFWSDLACYSLSNNLRRPLDSVIIITKRVDHVVPHGMQRGRELLRRCGLLRWATAQMPCNHASYAGTPSVLCYLNCYLNCMNSCVSSTS